MDELLKQFLQYGIVGTVAVLSLVVAYRQHKDAKESEKNRLLDAKGHTDTITKLTHDHADEMKALEERYIAKAEKWMEKNYELARELSQIAELLERRWGKDE